LSFSTSRRVRRLYTNLVIVYNLPKILEEPRNLFIVLNMFSELLG